MDEVKFARQNKILFIFLSEERCPDFFYNCAHHLLSMFYAGQHQPGGVHQQAQHLQGQRGTDGSHPGTQAALPGTPTAHCSTHSPR